MHAAGPAAAEDPEIDEAGEQGVAPAGGMAVARVLVGRNSIVVLEDDLVQVCDNDDRDLRPQHLFVAQPRTVENRLEF